MLKIQDTIFKIVSCKTLPAAAALSAAQMATGQVKRVGFPPKFLAPSIGEIMRGIPKSFGGGRTRSRASIRPCQVW